MEKTHCCDLNIQLVCGAALHSFTFLHNLGSLHHVCYRHDGRSRLLFFLVISICSSSSLPKRSSRLLSAKGLAALAWAKAQPS